jgi:hypothetical protein
LPNRDQVARRLRTWTGIMDKSTPKPSVRITNQFRKQQAMVYDLSCEDVRLTLEITSRESDGLEAWRVEAFARQAPEKPTIDEQGTTRSEALKAVARSWVAKQGTFGFPTLDWDAVADALVAVLAI